MPVQRPGPARGLVGTGVYEPPAKPKPKAKAAVARLCPRAAFSHVVAYTR